MSIVILNLPWFLLKAAGITDTLLKGNIKDQIKIDYGILHDLPIHFPKNGGSEKNGLPCHSKYGYEKLTVTITS